MARPTGNSFIDSILYGTTRWGPTSLTYSFDSSYDFWTSAARSAFRDALKSWSDVADIEFSETLFTSSADLVESYVDDATMYGISGYDGVLGLHEVPYGTGFNGQLQGWYNWETFGWPLEYGYDADSLKSGGSARSTFIHEIGHALGLAHPHDTDGLTVRMPGVSASDDLGTYELNQGVYTVMSYNDGWVDQDPWWNGYNDRGFNSGPGALDIAAIQYLYGADTSNNTGGTTYKLGTKMGWSAIWDTGGSDRIKYDGNRDAVINLNSATLDESKHAGGYLSYVKGADSYGGFTIAGDFTDALADRNGETGVIIEHATGGGGDDRITGNRVDNILRGNDGADRLDGRAGDDEIDGGAGKDNLIAGTGDDTVLGGAGSDVMRGDNGADDLGGGSGSDRLYGSGGRDELKGGTGNDLLRGGAGGDRFVFRDGYDKDVIDDFTRGTDRLVLDDNLWAGTLTAQEVVDTYGRDKGSYTVLNFGDGDVLTIRGIANPDNLVDDIAII